MNDAPPGRYASHRDTVRSCSIFLVDSENEKVLFKATTIFFSSAKPVAFISRRYLFDRDTISCFFEFVGQHARNNGYLQ